ncbi:ABC transporter ATP-binding protein [Microbacterium sediminicola]|uniref:ABC transporter ATP-binding protein n=1 Tax=Microbacterium sediminicola TaxID=415210 RepID=A0ABP4U9A3_9MICO
MSTAPASPPVAVVANGWGWRHGSRHAWALRGLDLRIDPGERVLLLGASGSGKSTLAKGLAGVLGGDEGESEGALLLNGAAAANARGRAGLVLQDPDSQVVLARVGDEVAFGCENLGVPREEIWSRVREALHVVGLDVPLAHSTSALSGGQKQRLALAAVVAMRPGLVILDEPTANLDPDGVRQVRDAVTRVLDATGATLVVVEHRVDAWVPLVDRVVVLDQGAVIADGPPETVLRERGADLAAAGVWVPGHRATWPRRATTAPGEVLLSGRGISVERVRGTTVAQVPRVQVRAGAALAITGPNGAGKSTLGLTVAGLIPPGSGVIEASAALAAGQTGVPHTWPSRALLTRLGMVFQDPEHQLLAKTVRAELDVGPRALGLSEGEIQARIDELLHRLRLERLAEANPYTLSGGEKRRLTVAAALATRPRVLVLDEPTFGQDARTWAELVALLARVRDEGSAVVAITHDLDVAEALGAERLVLQKTPREKAS